MICCLRAWDKQTFGLSSVPLNFLENFLMELIVGWHISGLVLVALAGQITFAQNCFTSGNGPLLVTASASHNTTINSLNYPSNYYDNMECTWRIEIADKINFPFGDYVLKVIFNDFELEAEKTSSFPSCPYDGLKFYDGDSESSPLLGSYCGTVHPEVIYSTRSNLYVKFYTDGNCTFRGFSIGVSVVVAGKADGICRPQRDKEGSDIVVGGSSGTIFTPDYPVPYHDYTTCVWLIYVPDGKRVKLMFTDFELGQSFIDTKYNFCNRKFDMDYVEIHDGEWSGAKHLGRYCGKMTAFEVCSSGRHMWIKFHANRGGLRQNKGFKAHFESDDLLYDEEQCLPGNTNNLNLKLTGSYGTLQSPEYYPPQLYCEWLITVPDGKIVELSFERFELDYRDPENGCGDYLQIHDGDSMESETIGGFCGHAIPKPVKSSGRYMYIRFQGDDQYDTAHWGFKATFKAVKEFPTTAVTIGIIVGVVVVIIVVCCVVRHVKRRKPPNRAGGVEIPMSTTTTSASRSTQPGVVQETLQPAGNIFPSSSVGSAPVTTNPLPPEYPYPSEAPPPYPGKEGEPQYPPSGQSYPWQQSSGSAPVSKSP